ncbi:MAG: DM13 domain-containing protein [bacterium]|nr:DM13 domain-containing protein [bacterium]
MGTGTKILIALALIIVAGVGYYGISPLFSNIKADDLLPPGATSGAPMPDAATGASGVPANATSSASATHPRAPMIGKTPVSVAGTFAHPASGTVRLVQAEGKTYVRYENFKTINGPDIFVYLATDESANDFVNLGAVKATEGNVNYEVPPGTDLATYHYVLTWCRQFSVLFNSAELSAE